MTVERKVALETQKKSIEREQRLNELESMVRNNRVVIRNTQLKMGTTPAGTVYPPNYPRLPVSLALEKLPAAAFKIWNGMGEFIYDDEENECSWC